MKLNQFHKVVLVALIAAQNFLAGAQTNNAVATTNNAAAAPLDYSTFAKSIADRNIFDPNRVPNVPWTRRPPQPVVTRPAPPPTPASFSLVGIIGYGEGKLAGAYAFFDGTSQQYRKTVQLNGDIATFKVADIAADSVTLLTGTNSRTVLKIGDQLHDDGSGHWLTANGNDVRYNTGGNNRFGNRNGFGNNGNGNGFGGRGGRQRGNGNNNFGGFNQGNNNNNGGFTRTRNNFGGTTTPGSNNSQGQYDNSQADNSQTQDPNMGAQDYNNAPPDNNMPPPDFNAPPDQGQQNN